MRVDYMANVSVKRVTKDKLDSEIEDKMVEGWAVKNRNDNVAILTKPGKWGSGMMHIIIFVFTFWTFGVVNIAYALYAHFTGSQELQIKAEE